MAGKANLTSGGKRLAQELNTHVLTHQEILLMEVTEIHSEVSVDVPVVILVGTCEVCRMDRASCIAGLRIGWSVVSVKPANVIKLREAPITALGIGPLAPRIAPTPCKIGV